MREELSPRLVARRTTGDSASFRRTWISQREGLVAGKRRAARSPAGRNGAAPGRRAIALDFGDDDPLLHLLENDRLLTGQFRLGASDTYCSGFVE